MSQSNEYIYIEFIRHIRRTIRISKLIKQIDAAELSKSLKSAEPPNRQIHRAT